MPGKITPVHHSLTDWDFEDGALYRLLSDFQFVSAPTSLVFYNSPGWWREIVLCRVPATLCLPQGEIRTWAWCNFTGTGLFSFRNQKPLGSADEDNCYYCEIAIDKIFVDYYVDGVLQSLGSKPFPMLFNQWVHYRIVWYNGFTPGEAEALCIDCYREVAGEWIKECDTFYDVNNRWKDSEVNRTGPFPRLSAGRILCYDDTEIWGPV